MARVCRLSALSVRLFGNLCYQRAYNQYQLVSKSPNVVIEYASTNVRNSSLKTVLNSQEIRPAAPKPDKKGGLGVFDSK